MSNEIFIILSENQISVDVFDKEKEPLESKNYNKYISEKKTYRKY